MVVVRFGTGGKIRARVATGLLLGLAAVAPRVAHAQVGSDRYSSIVVDARTGAVLSSSNADAERYPASLTKMMTLYMVFEALRDRRLQLDEPVPVSAHAASMSPTKLGLVPGTHITVEQAILGLVTLSANDAAAALAELLGGEEGRFGQMMTLRARALGMTHSVFENASGLPDPDQVTSARDMAVLARHLIHDFPDQYHYFSTPSFVFHGRTIFNHDHLLKSYPGADGMKTGYTNAAGHNLVTSALRDDTRLIGVVLGAGSNGERDRHMEALLDRGFQADGVSVIMAHNDVPGALMAAAHAETIDQPVRHGVRVRMTSAISEPHARQHGFHRQVAVAHHTRHPLSKSNVEVAEAPSGHHHRHVACHARRGHACAHGAR